MKPDLNGNEKHDRLPRSLPSNAAGPGTIRAGDVLLYGNDTLVVFYETFSLWAAALRRLEPTCVFAHHRRPEGNVW